MRISVGVENFGKIEKAKVDISGYTIFVGNNNSGKTYLMQLIYGVLDSFRMMTLDADGIADLLEEITVNREAKIDKKRIKLLEQIVNRNLEQSKEEIVFSVFQRKINIERLYIDVDVEDDECYDVRYFTRENKELVKEDSRLAKIEKIWNELVDTKIDKQIEMVSICRMDEFVTAHLNFGEYDKEWLVDAVIRGILGIGRTSEMFFPAARTGLLLLYRDFFANKADEYVFMNNKEPAKSNHLGLTTPVYDFLRFLQTTKVNSEISDGNKEVIQFIERNIIEGHLNVENPERVVYTPDGSQEDIPLYLTSSMINELAPFVEILSAQSAFEYLMIDEIETSLHPLKQGEMARLLNRMSNLGMKLIVSTHSDTMAAKINNLLMLGSQKNKEKLEQLGLGEKDIVEPKQVHVYQFTNNRMGKSNVRELEFKTTPLVGYDFSLFTDNVEQLYDESKIIMGIGNET